MDVVTRGGESGLDAAERIKRTFPQMKIIIVTSMPECSYLSRAREIGVESFWYKEEQRERPAGRDDAHDGGRIRLSGRNAGAAIRACQQLSIHQPRAGGAARNDRRRHQQEIAERLHMSVATVKTHILNMLEKTGFRNRTELAVRAREIGLVILNRKN